MRIGYARVSTQDQDTTAQLNALDAAGCDRVFQEKISGKRWDRPELQQLLKELRPDDVVVVWKLDRLSRSLKDLLIVLEKIDQAGAHFQSLTESIDTNTSAGRMMMHMVGSFAEFERSLLKERTRAGLVEARKNGRVGGRRPKLTSAQQKEIIESVVSGKKSAADMARLFDVHRATISRLVAQHRAEQLKKAPEPKRSVPKKKSRPKKKASNKKTPEKTVLDDLGLARPLNFRDSPGAVSVLREEKNFPMMERKEWRTLPHEYMSIWEAQALINEFKKTHADATIQQRYMLDDKTAIKWSASYDDDRADQRIVLQARDR